VPDAIDCMGFAGGFTLGTVLAGFRLVGKRELPGGFGVDSCEANRHLLGNDWVTEVSPEEEWTPYRVPLVFGNPPCSGFSLLSHKDFRGPDSPINECMRSFARYASRCHPEVAIFESVQPAFTQGRELMQRLRVIMEEGTGQEYSLTHVLHNASRVGGCAIRRRYFFVAHRIPFGVEDPGTSPFPLEEAIGDLRGLGNTIEVQPYRRPASSWWSHRKRNHAVNGHYTKPVPAAQRAYDLMQLEGWDQGEVISQVARRAYAKHRTLPESWRTDWVEKLVASDFKMGYHQMHRLRWHKPAPVMTGGAHVLVLHPDEDRLLTVREIARIQGFPDAWDIASLLRGGSFSKVGTLWGKGIPVESGRWIATWAHNSIEGQPGTITGEEIGEREYKIQLTKEVKKEEA